MDENNPILKHKTANTGGTLGGVAPTGTNPILQHAGKGSSNLSFGTTTAAEAAMFGENAPMVPRNQDSARYLEKTNKNTWDTIFDVISRPLSSLAVTTEQVGKSIGNAAVGDFGQAGKELWDTPGKIGGILTGTGNQKSIGLNRTFLDVYTENWKGAGLEFDEKGGANFGASFANDFFPRLLGTVTDIAADPLNFIGINSLTKEGTLARQVTELNKAGETVAADSKLAKQIVALGMNPEDLKFADNAVEQAARGQRAMLSYFANTRWEKTIYGGARMYELLDTVGNGIKASKAAEVIGKVFSTKTSNEGFDLMKEHYDNLLDYRNGSAMQQAVDIQRELGALPADDAAKVIDVIETGKMSGIDEIDNIAYKMRVNFDTMKDTESKLGLLKTDVENYFPHQLKQETLDAPSTWEKIKRMFYNADGKFIEEDAVQGFGDAKQYSTKLDAAAARKYEGSIAEIKQNFGIDFEDRPAIAYARRALGSSKAVTSAEFFDSAKQFGVQSADDLIGKPETVFRWSGGEKGAMWQAIRDVSAPEAATVGQGHYFAYDAKSSADFGDILSEFVLPKDTKIYSAADDLLKDSLYRQSIKEGKSLMDVAKDAGYTGVRFLADDGSSHWLALDPKLKLPQMFRDGLEPIAKNGGADLVETGVKELKGYKFTPDVARQIESYYEKVQPKELNVALRTFDAVQNWWKAQALTAPSYHVRNEAGNVWNNFLAGVTSPEPYYKAGQLQMGKMVEFTDDAGRVWDNSSLMQAAKQTGVINEGWYAKDIEVALGSETGGASWNPLKQNFGLFQANRAAGSALENNSRLALFINEVKKGETIDNAAMTVKKFLFDYGDLTWTEKNIFKRVVPFYTWTRKNIPLQMTQFLTQPGKFAAIPKLVNLTESGVKEPNEKYLGDYIKNNIGIRVGDDGKGNTMYFLLGNWLPAASAIDFLSQPTENFVQSVSPFLKTPVELWANQSSFFEDTFGQPSKIERYPEEQVSWMGLTMRKKTAYVLKNIRILNELDKLNPGSIFGDRKNPSLINRVAPEAGFRLPGGIGTVTTSEKRFGQYTPESTQSERILSSLFGKVSVYNPGYAKQFYLWDTETKVTELNKAIKNAQREGQKEYAARLREELKKIRKSR